MEGWKDGRTEGLRECLIDMTISRLSCPKKTSALSAVNTSPQFRLGVLVG